MASSNERKIISRISDLYLNHRRYYEHDYISYLDQHPYH